MGVGEIAGLIAAIAFAVLAGFMIYPLIRLGKMFDQISQTVKESGEHAIPALDEGHWPVVPGSERQQDRSEGGVMFKRIFWVGVGVAIGVMAVTKAQAYVKANTPDAARQFLLGPDQDNVPMKTLEGLVNEFNATRRAREAELNRQYTERAN